MPEGEAVAARGIWSGTLTFGLVSIPVELFTGGRSTRVPLRMLSGDGAPLKRIYVCPREEREIEGDEIVRGYEIERDRFVLVTDEELEAVLPEASRDIHLRRFVPRDALPVASFGRSYYLVPGGQSQRAYAVLAATMDKGGHAGIATFVMRGNEYLVAILAEEGILRAETLRFADELRAPSDVGLEAPPKKASAAALRRMERAIESLSADEIPLAPFQDEHADAITALAQAKLERGEDVVEHEAEPEEAADGALEPPDLAQLLKQRLSEQPEAPKPKKPRKKRAA